MSVVIRLKVPIEMHYAVIPMGTSKVNSCLFDILNLAITCNYSLVGFCRYKVVLDRLGCIFGTGAHTHSLRRVPVKLVTRSSCH